ncbi:unnamed protein product [Amoebophrya sp. A120]|nr:unnamed protein product [Amoebophrya sp. A120]|eukprot:GSA120T00008300001.1
MKKQALLNALDATDQAFLQQVEFRLGVTKKEIEEDEEDEVLQLADLKALACDEEREREFVKRCTSTENSKNKPYSADAPETNNASENADKASNKGRPPRVFECFVPVDLASYQISIAGGTGNKNGDKGEINAEQEFLQRIASEGVDVECSRFYEGRLEQILAGERAWSTPIDDDFSMEEEGVPPGSHVKSLVDNFNRRTGYLAPARATCPASDGSLLHQRMSKTGVVPRATAPPRSAPLLNGGRATTAANKVTLAPVAEVDDESREQQSSVLEEVDPLKRETVTVDSFLEGTEEEEKAAQLIQLKFRKRQLALGNKRPESTSISSSSKPGGSTGTADDNRIPSVASATTAARSSSTASSATTAMDENLQDISTFTAEEHQAATSIQRRFRKQRAFNEKEKDSNNIINQDSSMLSVVSSSSGAGAAPSSASSSSSSSSSSGSSSSSSDASSSAASSAQSSPLEAENSILMANNTSRSKISPISPKDSSGADESQILADLSLAFESARGSSSSETPAFFNNNDINRTSSTSGTATRKKTTTLLACKVVLQQPFVTSDRKYLSQAFIPESYDAIVFEDEDEPQNCVYMVRDKKQVLPLYTIALEPTLKSEEVNHLKCHNCREKGKLDTDSVWSVELEGWTLCDPCLESFVAFIPDYKEKKKVVPIREMQPVAKKCPEHPQENLDLWCDECNRPVCQLCKVTGDHSTGEFKLHHLTSLPLKHHQVQMDLQRTKNHFTFAQYQLQKQIDTTTKRIKNVEENIEAMLKMVRQQSEELEIQINKAALEGRNELQCKRGILDAFLGQIDYAQNFLEYISDPVNLDGGEYLEMVDQYPVQMQRLCADLGSSNEEYTFDESQQYIPAMAIEGEVGIIERCKPKYIFKKQQKNVFQAANITSFLKREVIKTKSSPVTPLPTLAALTPGPAESAALPSPHQPINLEPKLELREYQESVTSAAPPAPVAPAVQQMLGKKHLSVMSSAAPLSALGRDGMPVTDTTKNPLLLNRMRSNPIPYDIEPVAHSNQQLVPGNPLQAENVFLQKWESKKQRNLLKQKSNLVDESPVKKMFSNMLLERNNGTTNEQQLQFLQNQLDPDRIPISRQYRRNNDEFLSAPDRKFANLCKKSVSRDTADTTIEEDDIDSESWCDSAVDNDGSFTMQIGKTKFLNPTKRNLFSDKEEALHLVGEGRASKNEEDFETYKPYVAKLPIASVTEQVAPTSHIPEPAQFTLVVDSGTHKKRYRLNIVPKGTSSGATANHAAVKNGSSTAIVAAA